MSLPGRCCGMRGMRQILGQLRSITAVARVMYIGDVGQVSADRAIA